MNRLTRGTPWLFAMAAVVFGVRLAFTGDLPDPWWRLVIIGAGAGTALFGWVVIRLPLSFVAAMGLASARLAALSITPTDSPMSGLTWLPAALDIAVGLALCTILAAALRHRHGPMCRRDVIDVLAITIGASITSDE